MKKILYFLFALIFINCSSDDIEFYDSSSPYDYGWVKANKNGQYWEAHPYGVIGNSPDGHFALGFTVYNNKGFRRQSLGIQEIPLEEGTYKIFHGDQSRGKVLTYASFATAIDDGDVLGDFYDLDTLSTENTITVKEHNVTTGELSGSFNLAFIKTRDRNPDSPDHIKFENGEFYTKIINEDDIN